VIASAPTFDGLAREHPEWRGWLTVMETALDRARDSAWKAVAVTSAPTDSGVAPWLAGARIEVDGAVARRWLRDLQQIAADSGADIARSPAGRSGRAEVDGGAFLRAAIELDAPALEAAGAAGGLGADLARALAHPAALPLLAACAARAGAREGWDRGFCPVCGAWPAIAELRGLEASRQLRCGRCGSDWATAWMACVYCGNDDHRELAGLVSESAGAMRRVDTCHRCRGYLKSVTTLTARSHAEVVLEDMATVAYDMSALGAGALRPPGLGAPLGVDLRLTRRAGLLGWRR